MTEKITNPGRKLQMDNSIIPWREFLEALQTQQSAQAQEWLRRWMFTNEGAIPADDLLISVH
jgi:hypothetical protein